MSETDKKKWNEKYAAIIDQGIVPAANKRLMEYSPYLTGGNCLDLACGLGGNSMYLAQKGYQVMALDVSDTAIHYLNHRAKQHDLNIIARISDLDECEFENSSYDLIVMTYFLDRRLIPKIQQAVKPGGLVFMETFYHSPLDARPSMCKQYKLASQELKVLFATWEIIHFTEDKESGVQSILARNLKK